DNMRAALYASDVEDRLKRQYVNLNYARPLNEGDVLTLDFSGYRTNYDDDFELVAGGEKNRIWSLSANYATGPHDFTLAYQRNSGDAGIHYGFYQSVEEGGVPVALVDGGTPIWAANSCGPDFKPQDNGPWPSGYGHDLPC